MSMKTIGWAGLAVLTTFSTAVAFYSTVRYQDLARQEQAMQDKIAALEKDVTQLKASVPSELFQLSGSGDQDLMALWQKMSDLEDALKQIHSAPSSQTASSSASGGSSQNTAGGASSSSQASPSGTPTATGKAKEEEVRQIVGNVFKEYQDQRANERRTRVLDLMEKELGLTESQKAFVSTSLDEYRKQVQAMFDTQQASGQPRPSRQERQQQAQTLQQQTEQKVLSMFSYDQQTRYQQLKTSGDLRIFGGGRDGGDRGNRGSGNRGSGQQQPPK